MVVVGLGRVMEFIRVDDAVNNCMQFANMSTYKILLAGPMETPSVLKN